MAQTSGNQSAPKPRHVPQRTCVACRRSDAKRGLIRIVREGEGRVAIDQTGRRNGRGAYICHDPACWVNAVKRRSIERALRVEQLHPDDRAALLAFAQTLAPAPDDAGETPPEQPRDEALGPRAAAAAPEPPVAQRQERKIEDASDR